MASPCQNCHIKPPPPPRETATKHSDQMAFKSNELPSFTVSDYVKFFAAGALAATSTHGVR